MPYLNALSADFVWDDHHLLRAVEGGWTFSYFREPFIYSWTSYYRPLVLLSFVADTFFWQSEPAGFHATNLLFHLLNTALLFHLIKLTGGSYRVAALFGALWGLFPRLTESVTWVSGRTDVFAGTAVLSILILWVRRQRFYVALSSLFLLSGLMAKETSVAVLPALAAWDFFLETGQEKTRAGWARRYLPLFGAVAVYLLLRALVLHQGIPASAHPFLKRAALPFATLGTYGFMVIRPWFPAALIGTQTRIDPWAFLFGIVLAVLAILVLFWVYKEKERVVAAGILLAISALLPVLQIFPFPADVLTADRYLYIPLLGLALAVSARFSRAYQRRPLLVAGCGLVLLVSFVWPVYARNREYASPLAFWSSELKRNPESRVPILLNVAATLSDAGAYLESARMALKIPYLSGPGVSIQPDLELICLRAAAANFAEAGRVDQARQILNELITQEPANAETKVVLLKTAILSGEFQTARQMVLDIEELVQNDRTKRLELNRMRDVIERLDPAVRKDPPGLVEKAALLRRVFRGASDRLLLAGLKAPETPEKTSTAAAGVLVSTGTWPSAETAVRLFEERYPRSQHLAVFKEALAGRAGEKTLLDAMIIESRKALP